MNTVKPLLIYCYDAYCGWCYGFSNVIKEIHKKYNDQLDFEVLSGGMILPKEPVSIAAMAAYIQQAYKVVEETTGIKFGEDYLWHINNPESSDWFPNSEKPAIALCIIKDLQPEKQVEFATALQYALNFEGRDLTDDEAYRHLLEEYKIDVEDFYKKLHSQEYKDKAYYEFELCKKLSVTGFPCVFIQLNSVKFYLVAKGYTSLQDVENRIDIVLAEINNNSMN